MKKIEDLFPYRDSEKIAGSSLAVNTSVLNEEPFTEQMDLIQSKDRRVMAFYEMPSRKWDSCECQLVTHTSFESLMTSSICTKPFRFLNRFTTETTFFEHWTCRSGCTHTIHSLQGAYLQPKFFQVLNPTSYKTRTTDLLPKFKVFEEHMGRSLQSTFSKRFDDEQSFFCHETATPCSDGLT